MYRKALIEQPFLKRCRPGWRDAGYKPVHTGQTSSKHCLKKKESPAGQRPCHAKFEKIEYTFIRKILGGTPWGKLCFINTPAYI